MTCPGWWHQSGQKAPPCDSLKESYSILSHMYYLGELARKPCTRQEVLGSNPAGCKKNFSVWDICPGSATRLLSRKANPGSKTGTKGCFCCSGLLNFCKTPRVNMHQCYCSLKLLIHLTYLLEKLGKLVYNWKGTYN